LDEDNDGYVEFDMLYYRQYVSDLAMSQLGHDLSGYNFEFHDEDSGELIGDVYTNIIPFEQFLNLELIYSGSGPEYDHTLLKYHHHCHKLEAVPMLADNDGDGILNVDEDTNGNLNLLDDDSDGDGVINYLDDEVLSTVGNNMNIFNIFPNPVTNGVINLSAPEMKLRSVSVHDLSGKKILTIENPSPAINLTMLAKGLYFFRFVSEKGKIVKKVIIE
jgi:hypothetical protein